MLIRQKLEKMLTGAIERAQTAGKIPQVTLPAILIEHPQNPSFGDYSTSFPLKLARTARMKPLDLANEIVNEIQTSPEIEKVTITPPGFINFTLNSSWLTGQVAEILSSGEIYGNLTPEVKKRIQIEFVSVNPTGPLHVGHGRGAILGSTLANCLGAAGHYVEKEYYVNDAGNQVNAFNNSLWARYQQELGVKAEMPENGYVGAYMIELAKEVIGEYGDKFLKFPPAQAVSELGKIGLPKMIDRIKADLEQLRVTFDVWFSEKTLFENGQYRTVMEILNKENYISRKEGATWFASTTLGEDKDNVIVRGDGTPTYFASDIAYHYNKFIERKFDKVINIWGADHQGHVSRMKAVVSALGIAPERLEIIISQMVTLHRGTELVKFSKRSGEIITLRDVVEEVGADACRFFFLCRSADAQMDFDLELAKKQSTDNPVYYVQYAHARIGSILRLAEQESIDYKDGDISLLTSEPEQALIRKMILLPEFIDVIAQTLEPHHLTYFSQELATAFHSFYKQCRVISKEEPVLTKARLKLVQAAKITLANTLHLMGMEAPERM